MRFASDDSELYGAALGATLRAVRRHRRLRQTEIAAALGISRRTYLDLEAGSGRMPLEQLVAFADRTDSDRFALVAAILFNKPDLAVRCADNKLMTVMMIAADDFEAAAGDRMADLRPQELMSALESVFRRLAGELNQRWTDEVALTQRLREPRRPDMEDE